MVTQAAIVMQEGNTAKIVPDRSIPKPRSGYIGVKTKAVALNPTDWKHIDMVNHPGHLVGCDYVGVVEDLNNGDGYTKAWKKGDRIAGFVHGGNGAQAEDGAFADHIVAKADIQFRLPDNISDEDAATLGVGFCTVGQGLYQQMGLSLPTEGKGNGRYVLIYGGSGATGSLGIQFAKLSGYKVITTCSPKHFDYVKSLGAEAAFDYKDENCAKSIKKHVGGEVPYVWDTISIESSAKICADVIASDGTYGSILPVKFPKEGVKTTYSLGYTIMGEPVDKPFGKYNAEETQKDFEFGKKWVPIVEKVLGDGSVKPHKVRVGQGWPGVMDGLDALRNDKVSGEKLVYVVG